MYFHNDCPFFVNVMSGSENVWAVQRIQHRQPQIPYFRDYQDIKTLTKR